MQHLFSPELRAFIDNEKWNYAKTMPEWPHEYIVREHVDESMFVQIVEHIRKHGYVGHFILERLPIMMKLALHTGPWAPR